MQITKRRKVIRPVVISDKRYNAILYRARQEGKLRMLADIEEERRYRQYLKEGSEELMKHFRGTLMISQDQHLRELKEKKEKGAEELLRAEASGVQTKYIDDQLRKERILRAKKMLENMKPGPKALHQALRECEMIRQRQYNEELNRQFALEAKKQKELQEKMCPEVLIPFSFQTAEQLEEQEKAKLAAARANFLSDMEAKRKLNEKEKKLKLFEDLVEREKIQCLLEKEQCEARKIAARKREENRCAYHDALKEKKEIAKQNQMCDLIDDRRNCVFQMAHRNLNTLYNQHLIKLRADKIKQREKRAAVVCQKQQLGKRKEQELTAREENRYEFEVMVDEERRQCEIKELAKQRRAYQEEERRLAATKRKREFEIKRFQVAERLKNAEANKLYEASEKRKRDKPTAELRQTLLLQHKQYLERRNQDMMRLAECDEEKYLPDDKYFFKRALKLMQKSKALGRPLYPLAKVVEQYKRDNMLDLRPAGHIVRRNKLHDYCWPGYHTQADLKFREYERRESCREKNEDDLREIFDNCIKITKLAAEERPHKQCEVQCPVECAHHRGVPAIDSIDSLCDRYVCINYDQQEQKCLDKKATAQELKAASKVHVVQPTIKAVEDPSVKGSELLTAQNQPNVANTAAHGKQPLVQSQPAKLAATGVNLGTTAPSTLAAVVGESIPINVPATGQNRAANVPNAAGTWGSAGGQAAAKVPTKKAPASNTLTGQNRPAKPPNPSGGWANANKTHPNLL